MRTEKNYLSECEWMIKQGSSSFHKAFSFLPSPRKEAVYVIYAFCRMIDDAVDEPEESPYKLDELERHFDRLGEASGHFIWPALRWLFESFPLVDKSAFHRQMDGQRRDLALTQYDTMEQLYDYCYLVAGSVGEMLMGVLHDNPSRELIEEGVWLGKAMQIVNIIRDVGEDKQRGRRYLPLELLVKHGYGLEDFEQETVDSRFRSMISELDATARAWFERGLTHIHDYEADSAFAVELAAVFYRAILTKVQENDFMVFDRRAIVGTAAKLKLFAEVRLRHGLHLGKHEMSKNGAVS